MTAVTVTLEKCENVRNHPNADRLDLVNIQGYQVVVPRGKYENGQPVFYFPEQAIVPPSVQEVLGIPKPEISYMRLRGEWSSGVLLSIADFMHLPDEIYLKAEPKARDILNNRLPWTTDFSEDFGVTKAPDPEDQVVKFRGDVESGMARRSESYEHEHLRKKFRILTEHDLVWVTEKIHGTFCAISITPDRETGELSFRAASKSVFNGGRNFKPEHDNIYNKAMNRYFVEKPHVQSALKEYFETSPDVDSISILGEIYGSNVQKGFDYGLPKGEYGFIAFGAYKFVGGERQYVPELLYISEFEEKFKKVPLLYVGTWKGLEHVASLCEDKKSTLGGEHCMEGVVVYHKFTYVYGEDNSPIDYLPSDKATYKYHTQAFKKKTGLGK